jgi:orotate phosphoribosyltransferase
MIANPTVAAQTAEFLLQIKAIQLRPENPFTWASGWKSPIYTDNRTALSYPPVRNFLREQMVATIRTQYPSVEVIAGVATGAIALAALVAQDLSLPMVYVRPTAKEHGRQNQVEGHLEGNRRVVVVEDLISTGKSSLAAVEALRQQYAQVLGMVGIFTYGFPQADEAFTAAECPLVTLSDYNSLLAQAQKSGTIRDSEAALLADWRTAPNTWGQ